MRRTLSILAIMLATPAMAQMGGGMGGGMGGMGGGRGGGHRGQHGPGGPRGGEPMRPIAPIKRDELDKPVKAMFRTADRNGDGLVTLAELQSIIEARRDARIRAAFSHVDANHDGSISQAEFFAWQHGLGSAAEGDAQSVVGEGGPVAEVLAPDWGNDRKDEVLSRIVEPLNATMLTAANTNYDAGTSLDELLAYERARFDRLDIDHDGSLSAEEQRAAFPRREGRRRDGDGPRDLPVPPSDPADDRSGD